MERHEFKGSYLAIYFSFIIIIVVIVPIYVVSKQILALLFLLIPVLITVQTLSNKVVVENGNLRLQKLIKSWEIPLAEVSQMFLEEREEEDSEGKRKTVRFINVIDHAGHSIFTFSTSLIKNKQAAKRFTDVVTEVNPDIEVSFETKTEAFISAIKEFRNSKKQEENAASGDDN